jgi:hypothetical protein
MADVYFPVLEPNEGERYFPEYPLTENPMGKNYCQRISEGYKIERWKATFEIFSTWLGVGVWVGGKSYSVGDIVSPTSPGSLIYQCVSPGTSGSSEPSWETTAEALTIDGQVLWSGYDDNQITAIINFLDSRKGRVSPFYVYIPIISQWVWAKFASSSLPFTPLKSGLYKSINVEIEFEGYFPALAQSPAS